MVVEHGQDRAHEGHFRESLGNAIGDEISRLERLRIEIEFERALLTRWTYGFQDALLRTLGSNASLILLADTAVSHTPEMAGQRAAQSFKTAPNKFRSSSKCRSAASRL
jgi:hypothetical protein